MLFLFFRVSPVLYCSIVIVNYSFTGISGCLEFELEVSLVAWIRLGGCCLVYSPILRSCRSQILGFRSLDYQIQEDTRLAILLVKYRSLSYLDYTQLGAQKNCSVYSQNLNDSIVVYNGILSKILEKHAPLAEKNIKSSKTPWWNLECQYVRRRRRVLKELFTRINLWKINLNIMQRVNRLMKSMVLKKKSSSKKN